jgi:hypothetical protein
MQNEKYACMGQWEKWEGPKRVSDRENCLKRQHIWRNQGFPSSYLGPHTISTEVAQFVGAPLQDERSRVRVPMTSLEFFIDIILPVALWPGIDSASNRNEYQEYYVVCKRGRCAGLTTLLPSCADCQGIWSFQPPATILVCITPAQKLLYIAFYYHQPIMDIEVQRDIQIMNSLYNFYQSKQNTQRYKIGKK